MSDQNPFESRNPKDLKQPQDRQSKDLKQPKDLKESRLTGEPAAGTVPRTVPCEEWEALLADALDGSLLPTDSAAFEGHSAKCTACMELLSRAKQGQEWLQFLAQPPAPPDLVAKILAKTSGAATTGLSHPAAAIAVPKSLPFWKQVSVPMRRMAEPRLMMTAAMAFFSIALTLNLAGVRLSAVHAADLNPSLLRTNLTRQFINSKVGVENYCYNLRIFYEMEARLRELKRTSDAQEAPPAAPAAPPKSGSSRKSGGKSENPPNPEPGPARWGQSIEAHFHAEPRLHSEPYGTRGMEAFALLPLQPQAFFALQPQPGVPAGETSKTYVRPDTDRSEGSLA